MRFTQFIQAVQRYRVKTYEPQLHILLTQLLSKDIFKAPCYGCRKLIQHERQFAFFITVFKIKYSQDIYLQM